MTELEKYKEDNQVLLAIARMSSKADKLYAIETLKKRIEQKHTDFIKPVKEEKLPSGEDISKWFVKDHTKEEPPTIPDFML